MSARASVRPMTMGLVPLARVHLSAKLMARDEHKLFPFPSTPSAHGAEWIKYFLERLLSVALSPLQVKLNFPFALSFAFNFLPENSRTDILLFALSERQKGFSTPNPIPFQVFIGEKESYRASPYSPIGGPLLHACAAIRFARFFHLKTPPAGIIELAESSRISIELAGERLRNPHIEPYPTRSLRSRTNIKCYCYAWRDVECKTMSSEAFSLSLPFGTRWMMEQGKLLWKGFRDANRTKKLLAFSVV